MELIYIVEDDKSMSIGLEAMLSKFCLEKVFVFETGEDALEAIKLEVPDLIIVDIVLKGRMSGIKLMSRISHLEIPCICITAHKNQEYYNKAIQYNPFLYLTKPINENTLKSAINTASNLIKNKTSLKKNLFIRDQNQFIKIPYKNILYITIAGNYCMIQTEKKQFVEKVSLQKIMLKLNTDQFIRVHRNYAINLNHLNLVDTNKNTLMVRSKIIPIGGAYKNQVLKIIKNQ